MSWRSLLVLLLGFVPVVGFAQDPVGRLDVSGAHRDTLRLDRPPPYRLRSFVVEETFQLFRNGTRVETADYRLDARYGRLWMEPVPDAAVDTVVAVYRTLPFDFKDVYRRRSVVDTDTGDVRSVVQDEAGDEDGRPYDPFAGTRLQRRGSISRGVIAGNSRDVAIESGLRMELTGEITEGVDVQAVLTDENTPIQPEGTTQRINDFDRVFIQLQAQQGTAQLGDVDFAVDGGTFAPFSRKLQGAAVVGNVPQLADGAFGGGVVRAAGAITRGEFRTQEIEPIDGVQGPYRLEGAGGERFIIVIAGSEVVYLDGQRLTRGESNDYVIDYATGELRFTPEHLITEERRITVEFQYTTNQFTRTLVASEARARFWQTEGASPRAYVAATFLREADGQQFNDVFELSREDSLALVESGDERARVSGAEPVAFDPEAPYVQYRRVPLDPPQGDVDSIYVALDEVPREGDTVYRVRFSHVGQGRGDYDRVGRSVNGILYEFRGPGQGSYLPVRLLPTPRRHRVFDLRGGVQPVPGVELFGEWARSLNDENRFSPIGDQDDEGYAYEAGLRVEPVDLAWGERDLGTLTAAAHRRFTAANFEPFDRIRPVEFGRRWNLSARGTGISAPADEQLDEALVEWVLRPGTQLQGSWGRLERGGRFEGTRRALDAQIAPLDEQWLPRLGYDVEYVTSRDTASGEAGRWLRQQGLVEKAFGRLVPRVGVEHEDRRQRALGTDSLTDASLGFVEVRPGLLWQGESFEVGGNVEWRTEERGAAGALRQASTAWTGQTTLRYRPGSSFDTEATIGYRTRRFTDFFRIERRREATESLIVRWNGRARPGSRAVDVDWMYEGQTERTPRLQEIYVRTGPELGQYVWRDDNGDGIIQVDEFVPETTPNEGNYVQTFVPSDTLVAVASVQARLRLTVDPIRWLNDPSGWWQRAVRQIYSRTTMEVLEKTRDPALTRIYLLDLTRYRESGQTLSGRLRVAQDLEFFRSMPRFGVDLSFSQLRGLSELAAGTEERFQNTWRGEGRYRLSDRWRVQLAGRWDVSRALSDSLRGRRYQIETLAAEPEVSVQLWGDLQLVGGLHLARKREEIGDRTARLIRAPLRLRYHRAGRTQLESRFEAGRVDLDGAATGLAEYELTDGRGPGVSYLWGLSGQYRISSYLRATLSYDGRAPADAPVVHTARFELTATF